MFSISAIVLIFVSLRDNFSVVCLVCLALSTAAVQDCGVFSFYEEDVILVLLFVFRRDAMKRDFIEIMTV